MERVPIAEVRPELPSLDDKQFRAIVTIFWPYSSLKGHTALLLAEPDFRLRHKRGQVRVRFEGPSAKALGESEIAIGDEVLLDLRGARFVQQETGINTPGKSIDWELSFRQKLILRIIREGEEVANINIDEPVPSEPPTPQKIRETPSKTVPPGPTSSLEWSSPAFLKRTRLSNGPILAPGYDTLTSDIVDEGHRDKRRRRSYKDWTVWRYASRTPSPDKDQEQLAQNSVSEMQLTPVPKPTSLSPRPIHPPSPPVFAPRTPSMSKTEEPQSMRREQGEEIEASAQVYEGQVIEERKVETPVLSSDDQVVRDQDYYDLYAGPDEYPHLELLEDGNTDRQRESDEEDGTTRTEVEYPDLFVEQEVVRPEGVGPEAVEPAGQQASEVVERQEESHIQSGPEVVIVSSTEEDTSEDEEESDQENHGANQLVMPPPTLSMLKTDFGPSNSPGSLTPIEKEPLSPIIKPLDSSTLPQPSPFPGERDQNLTSYLDRPAEADAEGDREPFSEPEYIVGSSFYNPIGDSQSPSTFRPTHESAFTDLRFTFGFDGSTLSRISHHVYGTELSACDDNKVPDSHYSPPEVTGEGNKELDTGVESMHVDVPEGETRPQITPGMKEDQSAELPVDTEGIDTHEEGKPEDSDVGAFDKWEREVVSLSSDDDSANMEEELDDDSVDGTADGSDQDSSSGEDTSSNGDIVEDEDMGETTEAESDYGSPQTPDEGLAVTTATQKSEPLTEIIDLGSGSSDEDSDDDTSQDGQLQEVKPKSPSNIDPILSSKQDTWSPDSRRSQAKSRSPTRSMSRSPIQSVSPGPAVFDVENGDDDILHHGSASWGPPESMSLSNLAPSQELGGTQSRFTNTSFIRDSEEETLHSENSISTVSYSDDQLYPEFLVSSPRFHQSGEVDTAKQAFYASITEEQPHDSPTRETGPVVHVLSSDREKEETSSDTVTNREYVYYPDLSLNGNQDSPVYEQVSASTHQQSLDHSHLPFTPEQSQVEDAENQIPFTADFAGQSLPPSPQLTQKTSGGLMGSLEKTEQNSFPQAVIPDDAATTDVDNKLDPGSSQERIEAPSIGFMSSVGYYDPIRDLTSYLGRGANVNSFPASIWPDVFALVVDATTEPKRAEKHPYHYATTLRITDVSSFPQSTVVQVFRPRAGALPVAEKGDVILLRSFIVKTANHKVMLVSGEESGWVVWRWSKIIPGVDKMDKWKAVQKRMEINGPWVETQEAELSESRKVRHWWLETVKPRLAEVENSQDGRIEKLPSVGRKITNGISG